MPHSVKATDNHLFLKPNEVNRCHVNAKWMFTFIINTLFVD